MVTFLGRGSKNGGGSPDEDLPDASAQQLNDHTLPSGTPSTSYVPHATDNRPPTGNSPHFFSIPHWTKRIFASTSSARRSLAGLPADEFGALDGEPLRTPRADKDLPPTPVNVSPSMSPEPPTITLNSSAVLEHPRASQDRSPRPSSSFDKTAVNSVQFCSQDSSDMSSPSPQHRKNVQSMKSVKFGRNSDVQPNPNSPDASPRSRVKSESRKSSFWSRKQTTAVPDLPDRVNNIPASPSLPAMQPVTPFSLEHSTSSTSSYAQTLQPPPLQRRHSEKLPRVKQPPPSPEKLPAPAPTSSVGVSTSSPSRRPSTARASSKRAGSRLFSRPGTADPAVGGHSSLSAEFPTPTNSRLRPDTAGSSGLREPNFPRQRSSTNPPLLHRLSVNFFSSSPPSASKAAIAASNGLTSSPVSASPRQSLSRLSIETPKPEADESMEDYVARLTKSVPKPELVGVLASSNGRFYVDALNHYIASFNFRGDPLDIAVRRLLMHVGLPRETQQIDRVMEAFASSYRSCNPGLFASEDHPYILAFSLIMLHTDAFNKSNKRKMTKADYIKNTTIPGVLLEMLDYFYDNIVFAPFIFIEDPLDSGAAADGSISRSQTLLNGQSPSPVVPSTATLLSKNKIDPYYLIINHLLDPLRVDVPALIPLDNPYSAQGARSSFDEGFLLNRFSHPLIVDITSSESPRLPSAFFGLTVGGIPSPSMVGALPDFAPPSKEVWTLKVIKASILNRKDEILEGGKKPNRKWRSWTVILTATQLLLFRDPSWAGMIVSQTAVSIKPVIQAALFKPDDVYSLKNILAVYDKSYTKHDHTFRLVLPEGRHILFQAYNDKELNEWTSAINYASAFKTGNIRMRSLGMSLKEVELTGVAAATSHLHDLQMLAAHVQPKMRSWDSNSALNEDGPDSDDAVQRSTMVLNHAFTVDLESAAAPEIDGASQLKATFDQVKAELAAAERNPTPPELKHQTSSLTQSSVDTDSAPPTHLSTRAASVSDYLRSLESQMLATEANLEADMRLVRNIDRMTPFQKATRDRLQQTINTVSKRVMQLRLEMTRLACHRDVLSKDMDAEAKDFQQATSIALQAATHTLQTRRSNIVNSASSSRDVLTDPHAPQQTPSRSTSQTCLTASSDSGLAWTSPMGRTPFTVPDSPAILENDESNPGAYPFPGPVSHPSAHTSLDLQTPDGNAPTVGNEELSVEEQAEEWDKTRAAKRVSLVRLPPDLRLSAVLSRPHYKRDGRDDTIIDEDMHTPASGTTPLVQEEPASQSS
ncbi:hypothetical protein CONPUDRAFT_161293 [Coniophora puteana RWD-64-598 SS2]|uniref:Uncharacterized protein n=1 Tax=Coniophora puteana (strain RWD-64-598) TaxID=741705 RepID=A0A5M3N6T8_CONPW|nr:uncharacterized protein CONPUDRAFT_161293 [Coniophora puteana RWD-64-598 SS2]EIW86571.1 hypothetical protein CONPUDRAFT_161293 [Coniophora puteana RWD-64-598 SS2]